MSYTKLDKEIEKYYKQNNMPFRYNALTTTKEEQGVLPISFRMELTSGKYQHFCDMLHLAVGNFSFNSFFHSKL